MARKFNKGEWSEFYAFVKILADGYLPLADSEMKKKGSKHLKVLAAIHDKIEYERIDTNVRFIIGEKNICIPVKEFKENSKLLLKAILNSKGRSFEIESANQFSDLLYIKSLKQSNKQKGDIKLKVHDNFTDIDLVQNFSIKSYLGSTPTLLNASSATNINYVVKGSISDAKIEEINNCSPRILDKLQRIKSEGLSLEFDNIPDKTFNENLQMIDTMFPKILADLYLSSYYVKGKAINNVVQYYLKNNINVSEKLIEYNVKEFLISIALGMVPQTPWSGLDDANGGYIVVKKDGEIVCYYIYDRNDLKQYLYKNTHFDTPSSKRTNLGKITKEEDGTLSFKLTVQIRFK